MIRNEEKRCGSSLHFIDETLDSGKIIDMKYTNTKNIAKAISQYKYSTECTIEEIELSKFKKMDIHSLCKLREIVKVTKWDMQCHSYKIILKVIDRAIEDLGNEMCPESEKK